MSTRHEIENVRFGILRDLDGRPARPESDGLPVDVGAALVMLACALALVAVIMLFIYIVHNGA